MASWGDYASRAYREYVSPTGIVSKVQARVTKANAQKIIDEVGLVLFQGLVFGLFAAFLMKLAHRDMSARKIAMAAMLTGTFYAAVLSLVDSAFAGVEVSQANFSGWIKVGIAVSMGLAIGNFRALF